MVSVHKYAVHTVASIISFHPPTLSVSRDNSTSFLSSPEKSAPHLHTKALQARMCVCVCFQRDCVQEYVTQNAASSSCCIMSLSCAATMRMSSTSDTFSNMLWKTTSPIQITVHLNLNLNQTKVRSFQCEFSSSARNLYYKPQSYLPGYSTSMLTQYFSFCLRVHK